MGSECVRFLQVRHLQAHQCSTRNTDEINVQYSNGCGLDIGVKNGKVVGVRGRATDRVNKGRLGPKGLNGFVYPAFPFSSTIKINTR